jgi:hypothetical protein
MEGIGVIKNLSEKKCDPFLEELWIEYNFHGKPPFAGSVAEKRLKEICGKYANFLDHSKKMLPGEEFVIYGAKKISSSDVNRRELHDQIAVMVMGKQRSGMDDSLARSITDFAYEYSRGYKIGKEEKYKKRAA